MEILSGFIVGLFGSLHCIGMCGPLALALPIPTSQKSRIFAQSFYHLGRISSYAVLGVVIGCLGISVRGSGFQEWLSIATGVLLIVIFCFSSVKNKLTLALAKPFLWLTKYFPMKKLIEKSRENSVLLYVFGLLNGLLPCGFVYIALAAALNTSSIFDAVVFMIFFGLGTVPLLASLIHGKKCFSSKINILIPVVTLFLAIILIMRGSGLGIPYISPNLEALGSCCHSE
ncbi:sulfite exporter TauE/SafE family protein [Candidatus Uabimicrobium sp. HlEnr_7]|uniref:sulfite exporter TauE/SafE family protein n=1 Tax=Candidatus Uabimicrobium helgolandensis TaxID=3095367 RepID=UPI003556F1EA